MIGEQCTIKFKVIKKAKRIWSAEEDIRLLNLIENESIQGNKVKWTEIASKFEDKSSKQCYNRYRHINPSLQRGYWTKEEEDKLMVLINEYGKKWAKISKILKTRSGKQIRHHFVNILDKKNKKSKFSLEENNKLIHLFNKYGAKWQKISEEFVGRSADNLKCRYYNIIKQKTEKKRIFPRNINHKNDFLNMKITTSLESNQMKTTVFSSDDKLSEVYVFNFSPSKANYLEDYFHNHGDNMADKNSYFKDLNTIFTNKSFINKAYNVDSKIYNIGINNDDNKHQKNDKLSSNLTVLERHEKGN